MAIAIKKTAAIAIAAGLTFAGSAGIAAQDALAQTTNTAAPTPRAAEQLAASSTIPEGDNFSLVVNKRYNPTELRIGTGEEDGAVSGEALEGAKFKVEKLEGNIRDQAEFNRLAKLTQEYNKAGVAEKPEITKDGEFPAQEIATDGNGQATFSNLPAGAYLVTETEWENARPAEAGYESNGTETLVPADPFIVFLPMTNPAGDGWISNVNVYPKNSFARVEKAVEDEDKHVLNEDQVTYTLTGIVPSAQEGKKLDWFGLRDAYNNTEIKPDYENLTVKVISVDGAEKDLTKGTDFAVGADEGYNSVAGNLAAGANAGFFVGVKPSVLKPGDRVIATVTADLLEGANTDQEVENSVREYFRHSTDDSNFSEVPPETPPNTPPGDTPPNETPNDKVVSYFGNIQVFKTGEEDGKRTALEGAKFEVGKCNAEGTAIDGDAIANGETDENGTLTFEGLHVTDYADDAVVEDPGKYCLRETAAPAGYTFDKDAVYPLELTRETKNGGQPANFLTTTNAKSANFEAAGDKIANGVAVNNLKNSVPFLPNTGGMGVLIMALAGLAIIGGGVYAARRNSQSA
ncbi:SpaH/EbpB family LPXTG-anchored major pilin [Corynebacterium sp. HMSC034A01]|uniref:SpaH/EbpB family LPXTG-anchored major pilin n=1 Tax=Corynebacterium sp. HMSC034A01 TaxID=1739295 RepID=UPI0008A8DE63|nr:SpaH/EbpB family LPXTG-anchored major pilin [Corynebacterium sp. HMSC034A01]OHR24112.1 hypothetical protein HMPREF2791_05000 [Corynebacterium sp. HMSC034A01]